MPLLPITAIIPAAGKPSNRILQNSNLPDAMIPINGKPVIGYILEDLTARNVGSAVVVLNPADTHTEKYIRNKFSDKLSLQIVYADKDRGVGYSLWLGGAHVDPSHGVLVYLGDTIYKGPLALKKNFLITSTQYEEPNKWCFVESTGSRLRFINKPARYEEKGRILCGVYFFAHGKKFAQALSRVVKVHDRIEISHILEAYQAKSEKFKLVRAKAWYDCGNIENYHAARVDFLRLRTFNKMTYSQTTGVLTKSSAHRKKILQEVNWLLHMPDELKPLAPRVLAHKDNGTTAQYTMEYYGYQSLGDIFLYSYQHPAIWTSILRHVFAVVERFTAHSGRVPYSAFVDMYITKTHERLGQLRKDTSWVRLLSLPEIRINGQVYKNIGEFLPSLPARIKKLYKKKDLTFIHGDLCLSNILYDTQSRLIKLVDPRGYFGSLGVHGDIKYDLAKLRHSFDGKYEFIISDLFKLKELTPGEFTYTVYAEEYHERLRETFDQMLANAGYDLHDIILIEALLFLSMIPLHAGAPLRQKAMYITGIRLLNQLP